MLLVRFIIFFLILVTMYGMYNKVLSQFNDSNTIELPDSKEPIVNNNLFDIIQWESSQTDYTQDVDFTLTEQPWSLAPLNEELILKADKFPDESGDFTITIKWSDSGDYLDNHRRWNVGLGSFLRMQHGEFHGGFMMSRGGGYISVLFFNDKRPGGHAQPIGSFYCRFDTTTPQDSSNIYKEVFHWTAESASSDASFLYEHYVNDVKMSTYDSNAPPPPDPATHMWLNNNRHSFERYQQQGPWKYSVLHKMSPTPSYYLHTMIPSGEFTFYEITIT